MNNPAAVGQMEDLMDRRELGILKDELRETDRLVLMADPITKTVYAQLAETELNRLRQDSAGPACGHSNEEHARTLRSVMATCAETIHENGPA